MLIAQRCRQPEPANQQVTKRWFSDPNHDLFVWLNPAGQVTAFQFSYDKAHNEHLLSWRALYGYHHVRIDDGENTPFQTMTPIMVTNDCVHCSHVAEIFRRVSAQVEPELVAFIYRKLCEYGTDQSD